MASAGPARSQPQADGQISSWIGVKADQRVRRGKVSFASLGETCLRNQSFSHDQPARRARNNVEPSARRDLEISRNPASVIHARY